VKEDGPRLGDVGVLARFKPSDDFRLSVQSGQSLGLPENLCPPMPVMPAIVGGRFAAVDAALPVCAGFAARLRRVWSASEAAGSRGLSHLNADPPLLGSTMVGACIPNPASPAASSHLT
jgi:hypothetical protein